MVSFYSRYFWARVTDLMERGQRKGQAVFNVAAEMFPVECSQIAGSECDPFYDDEKISDFLSLLSVLLIESEES